jgi:hypothetical protein
LRGRLLYSYIGRVTTLEEIETAIAKLPKEDFEKLSAWMTQQNQAEWDQEFEKDVRAGKLDVAWEGALKEIDAGEAKPLDELCNDA